MKLVTFICLLFAVSLSACGSPQLAPTMTATSLPTNTSIPTPTATPVPMINVGGYQIPKDLHDSSIAAFAHAFGIKPEDIGSLTPVVKTEAGNIVFLTTSNIATQGYDNAGTPLLIGQQDENGQWQWSEATELNLLNILNDQRQANDQPKLYVGNIGRRFIDMFDQAATDKDNLIFGQEFNEKFLGQVWWHQTEQQQDVFTLDAEIEAAKSAKQNDNFVIGSSLVYPYSDFQYTFLKDMPNLTADQLLSILKKHIVGVMTPLKGQVDAWMVVTESRAPTEKDRNGLTYDPDNKIIGEQYIEEAFQTARDTDPSAKLIYEETLNSEPSGYYGTYTSRTREIVNRLKAKDLIDGIGIEMVIDASQPVNINQMIKTFKSYGVPVYVTGLTIDTTNVQGANQQKNELKTKLYQQIFKGIIDSGVCNVINHWWAAELGQETQLFDENLNPTSSLFAERKVLFDLIK